MPIDAKNPFHAVRKTRASLQIVDQARDLIAKATGNPTLVRLIESLTHSLGVTRAAVLQRNGRSAQCLKQNQGILQAIESRNSALAVRRMHAHIRSLDRLVFAAEQQSLEEARTSTAPSPEGSP